MRVSTPSGLYTYPDASIVSGEKVRGGIETITNPVVIVEVLSDSTRDYDRGEKFGLYRSIATLRHYLLIEQSFVHVEQRRFEADGTWSRETIDFAGQTLDLSAVGIELPLARVYDRVELMSQPSNRATT